jgi:hypothetical protein
MSLCLASNMQFKVYAFSEFHGQKLQNIRDSCLKKTLLKELENGKSEKVCMILYLQFSYNNHVHFTNIFEYPWQSANLPFIYLYLIFLNLYFKKLIFELGFFNLIFCLFRTWFLQATQAEKNKF